MTLRFMSRGEIAVYMSVSLGRVKQLKLPEPDVLVGRNQGWAKETIDGWLVKQGRNIP